jgi:hypothetical protein
LMDIGQRRNMKRKPIYFPASLLLLFVTSAMLYLMEIVFLPLESVYCMCLSPMAFQLS